MAELFCKRLSPNARLPVRAYDLDAGLDICSHEKITLHPGQWHFIATGLKIAIPPGHVGLIWPRSGLARQFAVDTLGGVIDAGYCGEVQVGLINHGIKPVHIGYGDRIAQLVVQPVSTVAVIEVTNLNDTERGESGFGSTS